MSVAFCLVFDISDPLAVVNAVVCCVVSANFNVFNIVVSVIVVVVVPLS